MPAQPQLVMVAGPNGSGKSTLIAALRSAPDVHLPKTYINADDLQREHGMTDARQAQDLAARMREAAIRARQDVMYETVMSHPSKIAELQRSRDASYRITLHFVSTDDPAINIDRVAMRVGAGGHPVPTARIKARYDRTMALAAVALSYADQGIVFDNTRAGDTGSGLSLQALWQDSRIELAAPDVAKWVKLLATRVTERTQEIDSIVKAATAKGRPPKIALLDGGQSEGPVIVDGKHYVLQLDTATGATVLHDKALLGPAARILRAGQAHRIEYKEGVPTIKGRSNDKPLRKPDEKPYRDR